MRQTQEGLEREKGRGLLYNYILIFKNILKNSNYPCVKMRGFFQPLKKKSEIMSFEKNCMDRR